MAQYSKEMNGREALQILGRKQSHYKIGGQQLRNMHHLGLWHNNIDHAEILLQTMSDKSATLVDLQQKVVPITLLTAAQTSSFTIIKK